jgi:hypothetical protein
MHQVLFTSGVLNIADGKQELEIPNFSAWAVQAQALPEANPVKYVGRSYYRRYS